ncbi:MAG: hypothetical protein H0U49_06710 [Parachlamydiaceae bacterium]|nr:hypothetical protein [Parachlamydiaceae bacterium]
MKHTVNVTLSLSPTLVARLHHCLPKRQISRFKTEALNKALDELQQKKEGDLESAYAKAFADEDRIESVEWNECDENQIENWEWYDE